MQRKCVYYVQQPAAPSAADAAVLQAMAETFESYAIIAGTPQCTAKFARLP